MATTMLAVKAITILKLLSTSTAVMAVYYGANTTMVRLTQVGRLTALPIMMAKWPH